MTDSFKDVMLTGYPVSKPYYAIASTLAEMIVADSYRAEMYTLWHAIPMTCVKSDTADFYSENIHQLFSHYYADGSVTDANTMLVKSIRACSTDPSFGHWISYKLDDEEAPVPVPALTEAEEPGFLVIKSAFLLGMFWMYSHMDVSIHFSIIAAALFVYIMEFIARNKEEEEEEEGEEEEEKGEEEEEKGEEEEERGRGRKEVKKKEDFYL